MHINLSWASVAATLSALAGVAGTVLIPIFGTTLATDTGAVLQALAALLIAIPAYHTTSVVAASAKLKEQYRMATLHGTVLAPPPPPAPLERAA